MLRRDRLKRMSRKFFLVELDDQSKLHIISRAKICQPKQYGGLGFRWLFEMNGFLLLN